jgi:hypothetical protein
MHDYYFVDPLDKVAFVDYTKVEELVWDEHRHFHATR